MLQLIQQTCVCRVVNVRLLRGSNTFFQPLILYVKFTLILCKTYTLFQHLGQLYIIYIYVYIYFVEVYGWLMLIRKVWPILFDKTIVIIRIVVIVFIVMLRGSTDTWLMNYLAGHEYFLLIPTQAIRCTHASCTMRPRKLYLAPTQAVPCSHASYTMRPRTRVLYGDQF